MCALTGNMCTKQSVLWLEICVLNKMCALTGNMY